MKLTLTIQALPKLPNRLLGAHWRTRSNEAKRWKRLVGDALIQAGLTSVAMHWLAEQKLPLKKARITFTRMSPRQCDADGLCGSFKHVLDALVHHGVIENDTPQHVTCTYLWQKVPKAKQGIQIEMEEMK
jgi:Holliday junction resolvase RusA-like endonuclease